MFDVLKQHVLSSAYRLAPFELKGDGWFTAECGETIKISCVINFFGRLDLLGGILHSLAAQDYPRQNFEVILVEDRGGTDEGASFCRSFSDRLNIIYQPLDKNYGHMGYSRNFGLAHACGDYVLFLDDDTIILQDDFLPRLEKAFTDHPSADVMMPRGRAVFCEWPGGYDFHDPHFPTSRCTAYRRSVLMELGGFMNSFVGQEDVEFVLRFTLKSKQTLALPDMTYLHPPLLVPNFAKPVAVGVSFARLRGRYPTFMLWLAALNCSRHAPLFFSWKRHHREMGRFGVGFLWGFLKAWFHPEAQARYG